MNNPFDPEHYDMEESEQEAVQRIIRETVERNIENMARDLCDTYYLSVNTAPDMMMRDAYSKITEETRQHWRAHAVLLQQKGWTKR